jgi:hypothetical protein
VAPARYKLGFYIPEDGVLHSDRLYYFTVFFFHMFGSFGVSVWRSTATLTRTAQRTPSSKVDVPLPHVAQTPYRIIKRDGFLSQALTEVFSRVLTVQGRSDPPP